MPDNEPTIYTLEHQQPAINHWKPDDTTLAVIDFNRNRRRNTINIYGTFPHDVMTPYMNLAQENLTSPTPTHMRLNDRYILRLGENDSVAPDAVFNIHRSGGDPTHPWIAESRISDWLDKETRQGVILVLAMIGQRMKEIENAGK